MIRNKPVISKCKGDFAYSCVGAMHKGSGHCIQSAYEQWLSSFLDPHSAPDSSLNQGSFEYSSFRVKYSENPLVAYFVLLGIVK